MVYYLPTSPSASALPGKHDANYDKQQEKEVLSCNISQIFGAMPVAPVCYDIAPCINGSTRR